MHVLLSEEERRKALEGQKDVLVELAAEDDRFYEDALCPWCKNGRGAREFSMYLALQPDGALPRQNLRCTTCKCLWSPFSGTILELGNVAR